MGTMSSSILLVDDDTELCESLTRLLAMDEIAITSARATRINRAR